PLTEAERATLMERSPVAGKYDEPIDRESAHEILAQRAAEAKTAEEQQANAGGGIGGWIGKVIFGRGPRGGRSLGEQAIDYASKSIMRRVVNALIRQIMTGGR